LGAVRERPNHQENGLSYKRWGIYALFLLFPLLGAQASTMIPATANASENAGAAKVLVSLTGDCVLGGEEKTRKNERSFDSVIAQKGPEWPFSGLAQLFQKDDITFVNLECVLQDNTKGKLEGKRYIFRGRTGYTKILMAGGVDQVNIANNHYIDYGSRGKKSTLTALSSAGIAYSGYEELYVVSVNGKRIGFGGIRESVFKKHPAIMKTDMEKLKKMGCDAIVYSCHFGKEYGRDHTSLQEKMARTAIDCGADIVVGHHPHVVQGVEAYKGGVILYSLGNFVFGGNLDLTEFDGCAIQAELLWSSQKYEGVQLHLMPVLTTGIMPDNDFRPVPAVSGDKDRILQKMQNDSMIMLSDTMFFPSEGLRLPYTVSRMGSLLE
jgi:poly-gamma-glutamate synthesis protein (capsule biosynthesis protein)